MATADRSRSRTPAWLVSAAFVVTLAAALVLGLALTGDEAAAPSGTTGSSAPVEVDATSVYQFDSLDEMVAASDLVVVGTVAATEPGRLVGDPDDGGVISRVVTIDVEEVVVDAEQLGDPTTVLVEEEGTLADGTPLIVNGVTGSEVGDHGIWFLDRLEDPELPVYLVINSQGRFLTRREQPGQGLIGGDRRDALVQSLEQRSLTDLVAAVRAAAGASAGG